MPADFFIDSVRGIVFSKAIGTCSRTDILGHMDRLRGHPDFRPEMDQLFDFRQVTNAAFSDEDVRMLATRNIFRGNSKRALVVSSDEHFGLGRMFETYRELEGEHGITIFREMDDALAWLSLSAEPDTKLFIKLAPPIVDAQSCDAAL
ncbi:MAG: hypothetical protein ABJF10_06605 [Chthoniobacter sp.]|uniref:hypothetical protein n=1 Tax=Chthoniobacter sp. TaxID=2510640 RepID=UPI0032AE7A1B